MQTLQEMDLRRQGGLDIGRNEWLYARGMLISRYTREWAATSSTAAADRVKLLEVG